MRCEQVQEWLGAYRDGELSISERQAVSAHLVTCKGCGAILEEDDRIALLLKRDGRMRAAPELAPRIEDALDRIDHETMTVASTARLPARLRHLNVRHLLRQVAAVAGIALVASVSTWWVMDRRATDGRITRDIIQAHIRSLLQDSPVQVASSDQHTVLPWFAGRSDFAPEVKDLARDGFPLMGGRLDYVADRRVAVVVYRRRLHVINVFMWPATPDKDGPASELVRHGYNLVGWTRNGVSYRAVSDLNIDDLRTLMRAL